MKGIGKRITVLCLTGLTVLEVLYLGKFDGSLTLWFMYGVYKLLTL